MRNLYVTLSFVMVSGILSAQNQYTKTADKLFNRYEYVDAAKEYLKLAEGSKADSYIYKQLAESYYNVFNTKEAVKWYAKVVEQKQDAETYYKYAQMLKAEGNFKEADKQMQQFAQLAPNDQRAKTFVSNPNYLPELKGQAKLYDIAKSDISSDKTDFGAVLTNDNNVYFASARNTSKRSSNFNEEPYLDIYRATYNSNGTISDAVAVDNLNTRWHDGPASITNDGNTMYYGSESFNEKEFTKDKAKNSKFGKIYLYKATKEGDKWANSKPLPFNNKEYDVRNPSISKDGKTLYFSSNMPGGFGGEDIWKVSVNGDEYGTPENLGAKVNTEANESFPFITDDNILFFSSNGKTGFGGLDVFKIDLNKGTEAINVGEPVNTSKDDFAFTYNATKKVGFFSSNRDGVDNIYKADPVCNVQALVRVKDAKTGKVIEGAFADLNGDNIKNDSDRYIYNNPDPDVTLGFASTMNYKDIDFSFNLRASIGNRIFNAVDASRAQYEAMENGGILSNVPSSILDTNFQTTSNVLLSDIYIENASYLKMDNVTLGYTFRKIMNESTSLRMFTGVQNVFVLTKYSGLDPEITNNGVDKTIYPRQRTILFGLNLKF